MTLRASSILILAIVFSPLFAQAPIVRGSNGAGYILLGKLAGANFNITTDQSITITIPAAATKYAVTSIIVTNASTSLTLAAGGFYAAASKTTPIVASTQVYTALTGSTLYLNATLNATGLGTVLTATTLFLSLTTGQGAAATADCYIFGVPLP